MLALRCILILRPCWSLRRGWVAFSLSSLSLYLCTYKGAYLNIIFILLFFTHHLFSLFSCGNISFCFISLLHFFLRGQQCNFLTPRKPLIEIVFSLCILDMLDTYSNPNAWNACQLWVPHVIRVCCSAQNGIMWTHGGMVQSFPPAGLFFGLFLASRKTTHFVCWLSRIQRVLFAGWGKKEKAWLFMRSIG